MSTPISAQTTAPQSPKSLGALLKWPIVGIIATMALYLVFNIYVAGQPVWAVAVLGAVCLAFYIYLSNVAFAYRYLFPGIAAMVIFVAFPMLYTAQIGFTNFSSNNLLSQERSREYLLEQRLPEETRTMLFSLHADGNEFRIALAYPQVAEMKAAVSGTNVDEKAISANVRDVAVYVSPSLALLATKPPVKTEMVAPGRASFQLNKPLSLTEVLQHRDALMQLTLALPDGTTLNYAGVREFAPLRPVWQTEANGALRQVETGTLYTPNMTSGFFETPAGERMQPGFKVGIGFANYARMITDEDFRGPFISIFIWTVVFSALTVVFTLSIGLVLSTLLNWEALRGRTIYRTLLFLPYAVPAFISILVFKGLFNQNFGEINTIVQAVFGVKPAWFADPLLAKIMILIVNTWLGYPYFMVLCSGLIKAIPSDLYEASALAGASPLTNLFRITAPLIVKPLMPLLVSVFAFNFNNFVVIALLTDGRPDYLNTKVPAGTTDILVSYTYRIAFQDAGQNFGLAAAISTVIFLIVALLSMANLKLASVNAEKK
jgi:maltose/maltodextrin transport system permease protein